MPLFAEIGPLNLDTFLEAESRQVVTDVTNQTVNEEVQNNSEGPSSAGEVVEKKGGKTFKITVVNSLSRTKVEEDEPPLVVDFVDSSIQLVKKNMKIPSSIKLIGVLTSKSFDIVRKNKESEGPLLRVMYSQSVSFHIIRHSTTSIIIRDKVAGPDEDTFFTNEV